jgi:hypothetical protein
VFFCLKLLKDIENPFLANCLQHNARRLFQQYFFLKTGEKNAKQMLGAAIVREPG